MPVIAHALDRPCPHDACVPLQAIATLWVLLTSGVHGKPCAVRPIILCPSSLVSNWGAELRHWLGEAWDLLAPYKGIRHAAGCMQMHVWYADACVGGMQMHVWVVCRCVCGMQPCPCVQPHGGRCSVSVSMALCLCPCMHMACMPHNARVDHASLMHECMSSCMQVIVLIQ